jgi:hypothetical protein
MRIVAAGVAPSFRVAVLLSVGLGAAAASVSLPASAYPSMVFGQPANSAPEQARAFRGEARLVGEVSGAEQHFFRWALDDNETDRLWHLELQGDGEGGVAAELFWPSEHDAAAAVATFGAAREAADDNVSLLTLSATPQRHRAWRAPLIVPPGEHLIHLLPEANKGQYQLTLTSGDRINIRGTAGPDRADAMAVAPGRQWFFQLDAPEIAIPLVPEGGARQLWRVELFGELGAPLEAWLADADGVELERPVEASPLSQQWGRLDLPEGSRLHLRHVEEENIGRVGVRLEEDGVIPELASSETAASSVEADEPGELAGSSETRHWLAVGETLELNKARHQRRYLGFQVGANHDPLTLGVTSEGEEVPVIACLSALASRESVCRHGDGEALFSRMILEPGDYELTLERREGRDEPMPYSVTLRQAEPAEAGWVSRPNDTREWAYPLRAGEPIQGHFKHAREAWFELQVSGEPQQWSLTTEGKAPLERLALYRHGERRPLLDNRQSRRGEQALWLDHVRLLPGRYLVQLGGENSDYRLLASPTGKPEPGFEQEPNDEERDANPLWLGQPVHGTFHGARDQDRFHFHLPGWNRVVLELEPPAGVRMDAQLEWQGERYLTVSAEDEPLRVDRLMPPGDYVLLLEGNRASRSPYTAWVGITDPWTYDGMPSPALQREEAPLLPEDALLGINMGDGRVARGFFRLPVSQEEREVHLQGRIDALESRYTGLEFRTQAGETLEIREAEGRNQHAVTIPGDEAVTLEVSFGRAARSVAVSDPAHPLPPPPDLGLGLTPEVEAVAPFSSSGQRLALRLSLANPEALSQTLALETHASHEGAVLTGLPESLELAPGEEVELPLSWELPPHLLESAPLSLFIKAGAHVLRRDISLEAAASVVEPYPVEAITEPLRGMADLAWSALGATFVDGDSGEPIDELPQRRTSHAHFLIDGMAAAGSSIEVTSDLGESLPPIRLAGEGGRIHAIVLNQRSSHERRNRWREVEVSLGKRHDELEVVQRLELASDDREQTFILETPREARYVQLRPLSVWDLDESRNRTHGTGLLRVLGEPSVELGEQRHNLLAPELGGQWIYTLPDIASLYGLQGHRYTSRGIMGERQTQRGERIRGRTIEMVFAFLHQRAAMIDELRWVDNLEWEGQPVERVRIYTATESPVGPWTERGEWTLQRDANGEARHALAGTPWARYLRLVFDEPEEGEGRRDNTWRIPAELRVYEAEALNGRRSILGYWGIDHTRGPLEAELAPAELVIAQVEDKDSHAGQPRTLATRMTGRVEEPGDERHYRLVLEEGDNTLAFALKESQRGRLETSLLDPLGEPVHLSWRMGEGESRIAEAVGLAPGEYRLVLREPPRSVVFIWDGSGSVANHQPSIYQALNRFAEGLKPGREVFNMMPLGGPLLIDGWAESPAQVAQTLNAYDNRFSSSDSDPALRLATRALERQQGKKAIFLITDAEQFNRDMALWPDLARVRPRIFSLEVTHGSRRDTEENRWYQDQMLSWAQVSGGSYRYTVDRSDLIRGFEAGMRELRQPTTFALEVERRYQAPPEPGSLRVVNVDPEQPAVAAGVVHLIFDASGSMLRQMEGGRRIEVARRIVQQTLDERIPDSVPVALRAYGHTEPHSCETELLVAPGDGSHSQAREVVSGIQAINLARTPLAASLEAVLDDLEGYEDVPRLVVMLTDGEETCDGDVAAAVDKLIEEGIDVRLNIVGFHIDEIGLQAEFERFAARGGGEYFDSHDGDELVAGLAQALAATWQALDVEGNVVARGRVDDEPVELDVGEYELVVETQEGKQRQAFEVGPNQAVELSWEK